MFIIIFIIEGLLIKRTPVIEALLNCISKKVTTTCMTGLKMVWYLYYQFINIHVLDYINWVPLKWLVCKTSPNFAGKAQSQQNQAFSLNSINMVDPRRVVSFNDISKYTQQTDKVIIDVRNPDEVASTGKIPSSINIPCKNYLPILIIFLLYIYFWAIIGIR